MATRYVNTASTAGGDGTTNATSGATRAYASLSEWEAARQANLTGAGAEIAICEGSAADSTAVTIDGWTTTASDYIEIKVEQANRHAGVWSTSHYRLVASASFVPVLNILEPYIRLEGFQVQNTGTSDTGTRGIYYGANVSSDDSYGRALIVRNCPGADGIHGNGGVQTLINCLSYGNGGQGFRANFGAAGNTMTCLNCVSAGNTGAGFFNSSSSNTGTLRNCYAGGNTGNDYSTNWDTIQTCYSEDGTQSTPTAAYSTSSGAYFTNITAGSEDFHIGASSALKDVGTDLSATFTTDIDGETRPTGANSWDVGIDEIVSGGGTTYTRDMTDAIASVSDGQFLGRQRGRHFSEAALALADGQFIARERGRSMPDAVAGAVSDAFHLSRERGRVLDDGAAVTDQVTLTRYVTRVLDELLTIVDLFSKTLTGQGVIHTITLSDAVAVTDQLLAYRLRDRAFAEALTLADGTVVTRERLRHLSESLQVTDQQLHFLLRTIVASEQVTVEDGLLAFRLRVRDVVDGFAVVDAFAASVSGVVPPMTVEVRVRLGAERGPVLGQDQPFRLGAEAPPKLGGYN